MNDKALQALIMSTVLPAAQAQPGLSSLKMARKFQPRQQGAESGAVVYFVKIGPDHRHGWTKREDVYNGSTFDHTERQLVESLWQFAAWVPQDPAATTALAESDVLSTISAIIQSDATIAAFRTAGVGIQRVTDVRNPYFTDDRDRFEAEPSFDITLTHYRNLSTTLPIVNTYEADIQRV